VLAAEFSGITERRLGEDFLPEIDSFLILVSFSERRRIVCYGCKGVLEEKIVDYYRSDISIPDKKDFEESDDDSLIDLLYFEKFMIKAMDFKATCPFSQQLFEAIKKAAFHEYSSVESEYLSHYSALENLINGYREVNNLDAILDHKSYKTFEKDMKSFIKEHDLFKPNNDFTEALQSRKRSFIYEKISELNRVSFGTAFNSFCDSYRIDITDLWPLSGRGPSNSLSMIRNRLVHGGRFSREEYEALMSACRHLQWTLERCILRVLDWDIEQSHVSSSFLSRNKVALECCVFMV
jgi:hypothetical protein